MSRFAPHNLIAKYASVATLVTGLTGFSMLASAQSAVTALEPAAQSVAKSVTTPTPPSAAPSEMAGAHDPARMQAWHAKRMVAFKARLKITPEQEAHWAAFSAGVAPSAMSADQRASAMQRPNWAELEKLSMPERLDQLRTLREAREGRFKAERARREDATKAFYATLQPEQKTVFDAAMMRMLQRRFGGHGEHGGGRGGHRGRMGDAGGHGAHGDSARPGGG